MNICLGNITFDQIREKTGYQLTESDRELWDKYHNDNADLSGMDSSFHIFDMPLQVQFRGDAAKQAIITIFSPDKLVEAKGTFEVGEVK